MGMKKVAALSVILAAGLCLALFLVEIGLAKYIVPATTMRDMIIQQTAPVQENPRDSVVDPDDTRRYYPGVAKRLPKDRNNGKDSASLKQKK